MALSALDAEAVLVAKNGDTERQPDVGIQRHPAGMPGTQLGDVAIDRQDLDTWWISFGGYDEGQVWRTQDQGSTWENVSAGLPALPIHALVQLEDGSWACGSDLGVPSRMKLRCPGRF